MELSGEEKSFNDFVPFDLCTEDEETSESGSRKYRKVVMSFISYFSCYI